MLNLKKLILLLITIICFNLSTICSEAAYTSFNDMVNSATEDYDNWFEIDNILYGYVSNQQSDSATIVDIRRKSTVITIPTSVEYGGKTYTVRYLDSVPNIIGVPLCLKTCEILNIPDTMVCWSDNLGGEDGVWFKWKKLKEVNISENSQLVELSSGFADCKYLKSFTIPKNLKILDGLTNCPKLKIKNIKICKGNKYFKKKGQFLLSSKGKKLNNYFGNGKSVKVPNNIKEIKNQVFKNKTSIRKITLPKGLKTIEYWAFRDCKNLSKVIIKNTKKSPKFSDGCFKNTKNGIEFYVKNIKIAKSLKKQLMKRRFFSSKVKNAKILIGKNVVYQNING